MRGMTWKGTRRSRTAVPIAGLVVSLLAGVGQTSTAAAAGEERVRVIVRAEAGAVERAAAAVDAAGGVVGERFVSLDSFVAEVPAGTIDELASAAGVDAVTPDGTVESLGDEWINDTDMGSLYSVLKGAGVHDAFAMSDRRGRKITGEGVGIALIDSGVVGVPGLANAGQIVNGPDLSFESQADNLRHLDTFGHGTHMAGIIVGRDAAVQRGQENTSSHFVGVAPRATLVNVKVAGADGAVDVSQVIAAIDWVVQHRNSTPVPIRVLNLSYGTQSTQSYLLDPLAHAAEVAWRNGIVVVAAAGNDGNGTVSLTDPAFDPYVLAVGASDHHGTESRWDDGVATFSNRGSETRPPDLVAPGRSIASLRAPMSFIDESNPAARVPTNDGSAPRFFRGSGTSQSAAVVSGVAALLLQHRPALTPDQVKCLLTKTADPIRGVDRRLQGAGLLDVKQAIETSTPICVQTHTAVERARLAGDRPRRQPRGGSRHSRRAEGRAGHLRRSVEPHDVVGRGVRRTGVDRRRLEREHLVGFHLVGFHLVGYHLVGFHLVGIHLVGIHLVGPPGRVPPGREAPGRVPPGPVPRGPGTPGPATPGAERTAGGPSWSSGSRRIPHDRHTRRHGPAASHRIKEGRARMSVEASSEQADRPERGRYVGRLTGLGRVRVLTSMLAMLGTALVVTVVDHAALPTGSVLLPAWVIAGFFAVTEAFPIHLHRRRDAHSFSLSELPLVLGLATVAPLWLVAARVVGAGAVLVVVRRQRGTKLAFNLSHLCVEVCLAITVFGALTGGGSDGSHEATWLAAFAATLATHLYGGLAVTAAISLAQGRFERSELLPMIAAGALGAAVNTSLALVVLVALAENPRVLVLLAVVASILVTAYRSYSSLHQGYGRLELLYGFTGAIGRTVAVEQAAPVVLAEARKLMRAERAEIVWFEDDGSGVTHTVYREDGSRSLAPDASASEQWWSEAAAGRQAVIAHRGSRDPIVRAALAAAGIDDGIAAPLRVDDQVVGVLVVTNRSDDVSTFDAEDLKFLAALANHAGVALENGRLLATEYQARHDDVTGLPNRRYFAHVLDRALQGGDAVAVMLMDLDGFKQINDSLGHATGDLVLVEVGRRLAATVRTGATVARLGGDEFAVVIPNIVDLTDALAQGEELLVALRRRYQIADVTLEIGASLGVALSPQHGSDAATLLKRADVAMYVAKRHGSGIEAYADEFDSSSVRRLIISAELRVAIAQRDIELYFQPKVELMTGSLVGAEALARWEHPALGRVSPEEFVAAAEDAGLIRSLTLLVLEKALTQCARWRLTVPNASVSVNVSPRDLLDLGFPDHVSRLLDKAGLPASALVLEITEQTVMGETKRTLGVIARLRHLGVTLSLDDFGTGHSSLTHLKKIPVGEIKIDRSFVSTMAVDRSDNAIVTSIVTLGHSLGMRAVAEGVEDQATWTALIAAGCDDVQGYYVSRPLAAAEFDRWLSERAGTLLAGDREWSATPAAPANGAQAVAA